jgi:hypothetical protein
MSFVAAGAITVLFAVVMRLTVREPPRAAEAAPVATRSREPVRESSVVKLITGSAGSVRLGQ